MENTNYKEFHLKSGDGTLLFAREWCPIREPKAWVTMSHGTSEHSGRYDHMGCELSEAGIALVMPDLHGSGQSDGKRGHIDSFSQYTDDLNAAMEYTCNQGPKAHFLGGHSLGGLIAARIAVENPPSIAGIFLSGALFKLAFDPPAWKTGMSGILSRIWPSLQIGNDLNLADLTHDRVIVERQRNDPYNHGKVTPKMCVEVLKAQQEVINLRSNLKLPLLTMHGGADKIIDISGSEEFHSNVGSKEKQEWHY